ncbi:MAG: hypothetical protein MZU95_01625 [Desulfomicrobium escambiense]|nr:hypothetical protein [Desulfomicrobium escambiense]
MPQKQDLLFAARVETRARGRSGSTWTPSTSGTQAISPAFVDIIIGVVASCRASSRRASRTGTICRRGVLRLESRPGQVVVI